EPGVLDRQHERLAAHPESGRHRLGLVLGRAGEHAQRALLVERREHGLLVRVRHADDPAEVLVTRAHAFRGEGGARVAERVLERVDDERRGNRLGHRGLRDRTSPDSTRIDSRPLGTNGYGASSEPGTLVGPAALPWAIRGGPGSVAPG